MADRRGKRPASKRRRLNDTSNDNVSNNVIPNSSATKDPLYMSVQELKEELKKIGVVINANITAAALRKILADSSNHQTRTPRVMHTNDIVPVSYENLRP